MPPNQEARPAGTGVRADPHHLRAQSADRGSANAARQDVRKLGYEDGKARLSPNPKAQAVKDDILLEVLARSIEHNDHVREIVEGRIAGAKAAGITLSGYQSIVRGLHEHADELILAVKPASSFLYDAVYAKSVACVFAFVANRLIPELDKLRDDNVSDVEVEVRQQALRLVDLAFAQYWKQTVDWFLDAADKRERWRQLPPFLR